MEFLFILGVVVLAVVLVIVHIFTEFKCTETSNGNSAGNKNNIAKKDK